jgi:hypothetical protein
MRVRTLTQEAEGTCQTITHQREHYLLHTQTHGERC